MKTWQALKAADEGKKIRRKCCRKGYYSFKMLEPFFQEVALVMGRYFRNRLGNLRGGRMIKSERYPTMNRTRRELWKAGCFYRYMMPLPRIDRFIMKIRAERLSKKRR